MNFSSYVQAAIEPRAPALELDPVESSGRSHESWLIRVTTLVPLAILIISIVFSARALVANVVHVGDVTVPESAVTTVALHFAQTGKLYTSLDQPPYTPVAYGPILYLVLAGIAKVFHLQFLGLLLAGRLLAVLSFFLLTATLYVAARRLTYPTWIALIPPLLMLSDYSFARWNATVRPDIHAILFSVLCITLALVPSRRALALSGVCAAIAVFLKFTYVAAPLAVVLWLVWSRRYSCIVCFVSAAAAVSIAILSFFLFRGDPILAQILVMRNVAASRQGLLSLIVLEWARDTTKLLVVICLTGLGYALLARNHRLSEALLLGFYLVGSLFIALVTSINSGANLNYYLEPQAAGLLALPLGLWTLAQFWNRAPFPLQLFALVVALFAFVMQPLNWIKVLGQIRKEQAATTPLVPAVKNKRVLSDDSYIAALGKDPQVLDPYLVTQLEAKGKWSSQRVIENLKEQKYDLVIFRVEENHIQDWHGLPHFNREVMKAVESDYVPYCSNYRFVVFVPAQQFVPTALQQATGTGCRRTYDAAWVREGLR
jgi:hypothetical protein